MRRADAPRQARNTHHRREVIGGDILGPETSMVRHLPIVAVFGAGTPLPPERTALARAVGAMVARLGAHLLTGAGYGTMEAVAEGFTAVSDRAGWSIGIVPRLPDGAFDQPNRDVDGRTYPNPHVEIAIHTGLPPRVADWHAQPARNHVNVLTADLIVGLPGGIGTSNELDMAAEFRGEQDRPRAERRTMLVGPGHEFSERHRALFVHVESVERAEPHVRHLLSARRAPVERVS
jgi:uncharacterized protein (TIGR00725 family)